MLLAILAFVGSVELRNFAAEVYVANLVGVGMVRELGALMAAFVVAGRTGAAFAAELGSMRVSQELDALQTLGIPASEMLVVPRVLALTLMLPLLTVYADVVGVLGGGLVGVGVLGISPKLYLVQTLDECWRSSPTPLSSLNCLCAGCKPRARSAGNTQILRRTPPILLRERLAPMMQDASPCSRSRWPPKSTPPPRRSGKR